MQDPQYRAVTCNLTKYTAAVGIDEIQDLTVNFDSKRESAQLVAMAIGRRSDQLVIDALGTNPGQTIAAGGTNLTYAKLRNVVEFFERNAVPLEERFFAMSGNNLRALLASDQIISRFYTSNDAVVEGTLQYKELMGMNFRIIPSMTEGGLPTTGNDSLDPPVAGTRDCFAWHKMAMGFAIGQDMRTEINYLPREVTWFVNGLFYGGAATVDNRGVFLVRADETVNP